MGNSPSTSKANTPTTSTSASASVSAPASASGHESPRASKREPKNLIPIQHQQRSAASPEASVVQAQGSTISNRNAQSRPLSTLQPSSPATSSFTPPSRYYQQHSRATSDAKNEEPTKPVAVPVASLQYDSSTSRDSQFEESGLTSGAGSSSIQDMSYQMSRPPRLPLPIEEEIHTPGSPIVPATDPADDVAALEEQSGLPRRASGLSTATDEDDSEELRVDKTRPTVPTRIEWRHGGQKVYVTGTPFQWSRKQRLVPAKDREGVLETTIPVFPGTHHIKFLVDGSMQTTPDLPTTVDFGNNLVNYIEVSGEDSDAGCEFTSGPYPKSDREARALPSRQGSYDNDGDQEKAPQKKVIVPSEVFSSKLPQYLTDFDQPEDTQQYKLSGLALEKLPNPPSLPGFLSKPILNNTTLIKDDNSVLNMPNHTVLNHLGTSSIKNNVLAVSATTRYRNKYVTTIIYKPTATE